MIDAVALSLVMAAGPDLPDVVDRGRKHHAGTSLYKGRKYAAQHDWIRQCIRKRESNNLYNAVSRTGRYRGAYQFSPALTVGAGWMIQAELRVSHGRTIAIEIGRKLRATPMNQWHMYWQDRAFWTVWNMGAGRKHWTATVPGTECK